MGTKLILLTFILLISACGKEVKISNSELEKYSSITSPDAVKASKVGMLDRGNSNITLGTVLDGVTLEVDSKTYKISKYHSHQVFTFINSFPKGSRISIKYTGEIKGDEVILQKME